MNHIYTKLHPKGATAFQEGAQQSMFSERTIKISQQYYLINLFEM